jgi:hypothetical protein
LNNLTKHNAIQIETVYKWKNTITHKPTIDKQGTQHVTK